MDEQIRNFFIIEHFLDEDIARFGGWEILRLQVLKGIGHHTKDFVLVNGIESVVLDLFGGVFSGGFNSGVHLCVFGMFERFEKCLGF